MSPFVEPYFWTVSRGSVVQRWAPVPVIPSAPVVSLTDAKHHTYRTTDDDDALVANWTRAAQQQVENDTGIKLLPQTWDLIGEAFPAYAGPIVLPFGPLVSVTHIKSYDSAATPVLQAMAASDYVVDTASLPGRIGLADAASWPTDLRAFQPVTIRVVVGYASVAVAPEPLLQAVQLAIAFHSENREPTVIERASYDWLVDPYRQVVLV